MRNSIRLILSCAVLSLALETTVHATGGYEGTFEYAFDAPWRIEPHIYSDGTVAYGAIPIQISIHDAMHAGLDSGIWPLSIIPVPGMLDMIGLGNFCKVIVRESGSEPRSYFLDDLTEIEMTKGAWPWPKARTPEHDISRAWAGDDSERFRDLSETSEWHALLWYQPEQTPTPGSVVSLEIEVELTRQPWVTCDGTVIGDHPSLPGNYMMTLKNHVRVYFGDEPLPRFDNNWLYGDLHYHSQGTDNEGESAYNYRGVIRAMGALGIDFVFATEHASNSEQIIDADIELDIVDVDVDFEIDAGIPLVDILDDDKHNAYVKGGVLRDMSRQRFGFNHGLIYGENGVNNEAALNAYGNRLPQGYLSHGVVPQIFLGGELDVIPEIGTLPSGPMITYGNGLSYDVEDLCKAWESSFTWQSYYSWIPGLGSFEVFDDGCDRDNLWEAATNGYLIRDVQGINKFDYGREHMVYLPKTSQLEISVEPQALPPSEPWCLQAETTVSPAGKPVAISVPVPCSECDGPCPETVPPSPPVGTDTTFIASHTGNFGGASRRLVYPHKGKKPMLPEIEKKGYTFIAHHLNAPKGSEGPEGPPWSIQMLRQAWESPAVLGLQFWNENGRLRSTICRLYQDGECEGDEGGHDIGYERNETFEILGFDVDKDPKPVNSARRGFLDEVAFFGNRWFELLPWNIETGEWEERKFSIEHKLHHGAYSWDLMNHWGLDINLTNELDWLAPGEPRRFFMAGGSDAHGDLNFRRVGYFLRTTDTNDTAIGQPRNLVLVGRPKTFGVPNPNVIDQGNDTSDAAVAIDSVTIVDEKMPSGSEDLVPLDVVQGEEQNAVTLRYHTQEEVVDALAKGRFSVTDGPALRIAIDRNGNNRIDRDDIQMGGIVELYGDEPLKLLVEWKSTPEFGPVTKVDLYVGAQSSRLGVDGSARTYAPQSHGTRDCIEGPLSRPDYSYSSGGRTYTKMEDGYWLDRNLRIRPTDWGDIESFTYAGTSARSFDLDQFLVDDHGSNFPGDRFFIRAFAETNAETISDCHPYDPIPRYAFTNPIWVIRHEEGNPFVAPDQTIIGDTVGTFPEENVTQTFDSTVEIFPNEEIEKSKDKDEDNLTGEARGQILPVENVRGVVEELYFANGSGSQVFTGIINGVSTDATCTASFRPSDAERMKYKVRCNGINGVTEVTMHIGSPQENGGVVAVLFPDGEPTEAVTGVIRRDTEKSKGTLTDADVAGTTVSGLIETMRAGNTYFNVLTETHPDGEVRGQIVRMDMLGGGF